MWNRTSRVPNIDSVPVGHLGMAAPPIESLPRSCTQDPAIPEEWITTDLDLAVFRSKPAGVVEEVDEKLLHLGVLEIHRTRLRFQIHADRDVLAFARRIDFVQGLIEGFLQVVVSEFEVAFHVPPYTELKHRGCHPGESFGTALHPFEHLFLLPADRSQTFAEQKTAVTANCRQRRPKIMNAAGQEIGPVLVIFLQRSE